MAGMGGQLPPSCGELIGQGREQEQREAPGRWRNPLGPLGRILGQ